MFTLLRLLFWPILLAVISIAGFLFNLNIWGICGRWFIGAPVENSFVILLVLTIIYYAVFTMRYWYAYRAGKKLVSMKVILPRSDSKMDQEKRTEKDFKEKIAIMEQLFRAVNEVKDLTFWQVIHFWIFRYITISFELFVEDGLITFYVLCPGKLTSIIEKQITSYYPNADVSLTPTPEIWPEGYKLSIYNMITKKPYMYPLRFFDHMQDDPLNDLTNALSKLHPEEKASVQVIVTPVFGNYWSKKTKAIASQSFKGKKETVFDKIPGLKLVGTLLGMVGSSDSATLAPGAKSGDSFVRMIAPEEELYKRMGEKAGMSGFHTTIRIMAAAKTWERANDITNNLQVSFNVFKDQYGNFLKNRRMIIDFLPMAWNQYLIYPLWKRRVNGFAHKRNLLVEKELASIFHFPDSRYNTIPNLQWILYKILPPPPNAPQEGIILGINRHRAVETSIRFLDKDRTRHQYIIGKSGSGKSALLNWQSRQDIANGEGLCVIDPHGDLIEDALAHTPKERAKDVIVFDPSDGERPMGLNLLEATTPEEKDRASLDAMEIFIKMFGNEIFGPRIQHYFRNGCLTLMDDEEEGATLLDVPRLFVDEEFQRYKVAKCRNAVVRSFWENEMAKTGQREKEEMIPYFSAKFGPFVTNTTMRNIIGQPKSAFNVREVMDSGKVLLVNLSKGKIGDVNAQLLGLIFVNKVNMAAMSRADVPQRDRKRFYLYVDEFQNFITDAFATILSEARKYELGLIMAHQYIGQLVGKTEGYGQASTKMRDAVFGNVGTIMSFKIGAEDAEYMAKEFAPVLSEQDVIGIPNFNCYVKLNINNTTSRPFSLATIYDESERNEKLGSLIKEYSRMKYGRKKAFVDQEIEDRIGITKAS
ncbi:MAG: type IV secretory system conjugative DNA transfer family protein [Candidatus Peribacteraceae bacterium]|nr:type IV secretory system conjugative DNA transfer family protein [Candidatus Peribacteraceae bacterium]